MKKLVAALLVSVGFVSAAGATTFTTYSLGALDSTPALGIHHVSKGSFSDYLNFDLASPYNLVTGVVLDLSKVLSFGFGSSSDIRQLTVALWDGYGGTGAMLYQSGVGDFQWKQDSLSKGDYSLVVSGKAIGQHAAYGYALIAQAATAPVPEPGEWALMLSGLGLVGAVIRRRTKSRAE
jgi:hypothetical protein